MLSAHRQPPLVHCQIAPPAALAAMSLCTWRLLGHVNDLLHIWPCAKGGGAGLLLRAPQVLPLHPLAAQARGSDLRVHFKNTRETAFAIKKMSLNKAKKYLEDVVDRKRAIPFRRYTGCIGRTAQAKNEGNPCGQGRWPVKSCEFLLNLLKNAESNAEVRSSGGAQKRDAMVLGGGKKLNSTTAGSARN